MIGIEEALGAPYFPAVLEWIDNYEEEEEEERVSRWKGSFVFKDLEIVTEMLEKGWADLSQGLKVKLLLTLCVMQRCDK